VGFGSTLVAIVAILAIVWLRGQKLRRDGELPDARHDAASRFAERDAYTGELEREVIELRKRVEVLERIATDDTRRLSHEIEKLRDS
jgi:hypothetical protein